MAKKKNIIKDGISYHIGAGCGYNAYYCDFCGTIIDYCNCRRLRKKIYSEFENEINVLKKDLNKQCRRTEKFGEELQLFKRKKHILKYEVENKKLRDQVITLKKKNSKLREEIYNRNIKSMKIMGN